MQDIYVDDYKQVLLSILQVIDYKEDREVFAKQFIENTQMQTLIDLVASLPDEKQTEINKKLNESADDLEKMSTILKAEFTEEQTQKALENAIKNALTGWMQAISGSLSKEQKENLIQLAKSLKH